MNGKNIFVIGLLLLGLDFCAFSQQDIPGRVSEEKGRESGYIYAFSEATKSYLLGDFGRAASLYKECLKYEPASGAVNYQMAQLYLKAGDINTAHQFAHKACLYDPENRWYVMQMAGIYQAEQMYDSAIVMYKTLLDGSGGDVRVFFLVSSLMEKKGDYKGALIYLNKVEEKSGVSVESAVNKSRVYDRLGLKREALGELKLALHGKEDDYVVYGIIAEFYRTHRNSDSAEYYYKKVIPGHQEDANLMFSYGEFLIEQKRISEARRHYSSLYENRNIDENVKYGYLYNAIQDQGFFNRVRPVLDTLSTFLLKDNLDNVSVMSLYSDINYRLGNFKASGNVLQKIMAKDQNNYSAWEQMIFCESAMGKPDSVLYYGEKAILKFESRPLPYLMVASVYYSRQKYREAIDLLEKGESYTDTDALKIEFYSILAECFGRTEEVVKSERYYESALAIDSLNVPILNNYAYSLAVRRNNLPKAKSMSQITIEKEPFNGTYLDTYAWILYQEADYKNATKYIKKAVAYGEGRNPEVLEHYGDILIKRGKSGKAVEIYNEAMKWADKALKEKLSGKIEGIKMNVL